MSDNASSEPTKLSDKVKKLAFQGVAGTISLTAAAVIPLLAQRFLAPPAATPDVTTPVQVQSVTPQQVASPSPAASEQVTNNSNERGDREKRRGRDRDKDK